MAILSKIRQRTVILIAIIALALFAFVLSDVINNGGFSGAKTSTTVGVIGDEKIEQDDFARQLENYRNTLGPTASTMRGVNEVWNREVSQALLRQEFKSLGLQASREQILEVMAQQLEGNPNFSTEDGLFSESKMVEYVANIKETDPVQFASWEKFMDNIEVQVLTDSYYNMIQAGLNVTLFEAERIYKLNNDNLNLQFAYVPYEDMEEVEVTKSEISSYINDHKKQFKQEPKVDLEYVLFEELPSAEDDADIKQTIELLIPEFKKAEDNVEFVNLKSDKPAKFLFQFDYELNDTYKDQLLDLEIGEVFGPYKEGDTWKLAKLQEVKRIPDSMDVKHILITYNNLAGVSDEETLTKERAKNLATALANNIRIRNYDFDSIARNYSADKQSGANGGKLGRVKYGSLFRGDKDFNDKTFAINDGGIEVIESEYGYHIVSVSNPTTPKEAYKIAMLSRDVVPSDKTTNGIYRKASNFLLDSRKKDFEELAKEYDVQVKPINSVKLLDERVGGLGMQRPIIKWAFDEEQKEGNTEFFEVENGYVIAKLVSRTEEGLQSVEVASAQVTPILKKEKQAKKILEQVKSNSLEEFTAQFGVELKNASAVNLESPLLPGVGEEPSVVGAAFGLEEGATSNAIQGEKGVFMVKLLKRNKAAELPSYAGIAKQETDQRLQNIRGANSKLIEALKETREIEDNRAKFY